MKEFPRVGVNDREGERICRRKERYKTIRFQENANRKISDYKINEFPKFLKLLHKQSRRHFLQKIGSL